MTKLLGLHYRIEYRKGALNQAADALSRHPNALACVISVCVPRWLDEVKQGYAQDSKCTNMLSSAKAGTTLVGPFKVQDGLIHYKGRVWIGNNTAVQQRILQELHSGVLWEDIRESKQRTFVSNKTLHGRNSRGW